VYKQVIQLLDLWCIAWV